MRSAATGGGWERWRYGRLTAGWPVLCYCKESSCRARGGSRVKLTNLADCYRPHLRSDALRARMQVLRAKPESVGQLHLWLPLFWLSLSLVLRPLAPLHGFERAVSFGHRRSHVADSCVCCGASCLRLRAALSANSQFGASIEGHMMDPCDRWVEGWSIEPYFVESNGECSYNYWFTLQYIEALRFASIQFTSITCPSSGLEHA